MLRRFNDYAHNPAIKPQPPNTTTNACQILDGSNIASPFIPSVNKGNSTSYKSRARGHIPLYALLR
jgi:hypothetical protein